eukprot:scaffold361409_cov20-Prasinocladus_malaysianus.AAC.1
MLSGANLTPDATLAVVVVELAVLKRKGDSIYVQIRYDSKILYGPRFRCLTMELDTRRSRCIATGRRPFNLHRLGF